MMNRTLQLDPARYERHPIHREERVWAETNCYVDIWIELLHAWDFEPIAAMPFTFGIDFEGDQWTFFKFPHSDLYDLYGLDVQELAIWRPLATHLDEQIALGRPVLVELDSFYLPDTAGTAYRIAHVKSTVAVVEIDVDKQHLGYFHGQGYYHLSGDDFVNVLRVHETNPAMLPPYAEIVKRRRSGPPRQDEMTQISLALLRRQLDRLPDANPFEKFKERFQTDLAWLGRESLEMFHQYSFATLRQFGAATNNRRPICAGCATARGNRSIRRSRRSRKFPAAPKRCNSTWPAPWRARNRWTSPRWMPWPANGPAA